MMHSKKFHRSKSKKQYNLNNKRACPQTMFKIVRLRRQCCQIKEDRRGCQKHGGNERERAENKNPGGGGHLQRTGRPNSVTISVLTVI
jgi:hypothetical protein